MDYGQFGYALSRYCGSWVGIKIVTNVADAFETAEVGTTRLDIQTPAFQFAGRDWRPKQDAMLIVPESMIQEQELVTARLDAARHFIAVNGINRITVPASDAWLGIAAAGKCYYIVRQALHELGLGRRELERYGIRILKLGALYPLEEGIVRKFAQGLEEIFVVEEKRAFLELFIQSALYGVAERPRIIGKRDERGAPLLPPYGSLDSDMLRGLLAARLARRLPADLTHRWHAPTEAAADFTIPLLARTPYYCSGCPHNRSTVVPEGSLAIAGNWLPHDGALYGPRHLWPYANGWRGGALGGHVAIYRDGTRIPEHRRWHPDGIPARSRFARPWPRRSISPSRSFTTRRWQ